MIIGEFFTALVERIAVGGSGVLHYQGQSIFMDTTAPGDLVVGRIREEHKGWAKAELVEILEASPNRTSPLCPHYEVCGGCSLQHLSYEAQVAEKSAILQDALVRIGGLAALPNLQIYSSPPFEYRNRVQFHRINQPRHEALGFKARKGETIIPLDDCLIADPEIRRALGEGRLLLPLEKDRFTVYARGKTFLSEGGIHRGRVSLLNRELLMDAGIFFQSNGIMLEKVIQDLLSLAEIADHSLPMADLYCGVGTFAAFLQDVFSRIVMVEQNKPAISIARENVRGRDIQPIALSSDQWVKTLKGKGMPYSFIVVDPPRQGLSPLLRNRLAQEGPPLLAYLSCDPATLARDSRVLTLGTYRLEALSFYDFYPQTAHIESLAVFTKG
jgi:23S rRNA (uracil1939-C5)-methyltransferase